MKISIESHNGDDILDGESLYLEGSLIDGIPSFTITVQDSEKRNFDILFSFRDKEQLDAWLDTIKKVVQG